MTDGVREHGKRAEPEGFGARGAARRAPPVEAGPGGKANFQQRLMGGVSTADEPRRSSEGPGQSAGPGRRVPRASRGGEAQAWQCPPLLSAPRQTPRRQGPSAIAARRGCRFRPMVGGGWRGDGGPHDGRDLGEGREPPTVRLLNFPVLGVAAPAGPGRRSPQLCPPTAPRGGAAHPMFPFRGQRGQRSPWGASPSAVPAGPARSWLQDEGPRVSTPLPGPGPWGPGLG